MYRVLLLALLLVATPLPAAAATPDPAPHPRVVFLLAPTEPEAPSPPRPDDPWLGPDKALHAGASLLLTLSGQYVLASKMNLPEERAWPVAAGTALAFGLFKELADSQRPQNPLFSWRDMAANTAGVALGVAIILL